VKNHSFWGKGKFPKEACEERADGRGRRRADEKSPAVLPVPGKDLSRSKSASNPGGVNRWTEIHIYEFLRKPRKKNLFFEDLTFGGEGVNSSREFI